MANDTTRCGYIAIVGVPNAGKSTLLNQLVGGKLAIVTPKEQTTRNRITGIMAHENAQLIFIDTPGIFAASQRFEKAMVASAWSGVKDADITLLLIDARRGIDEGTEAIIAALKERGKPAVAALNKIDAVPKENLFALAQKLGETQLFQQIFMISAMKGDGVGDMVRYLAGQMPPHPFLFPEDQMSDMPQRLLASEITREKLFLKLHEELPYSLAVETESWETLKDGSAKIHQSIFVQRESQKKIVLGKSGAMLKSIGESARREIERVLEIKAHLFLFVKVREDWKNKPEAYKYLGLEF